jgi:hypothetical protein
MKASVQMCENPAEHMLLLLHRVTPGTGLFRVGSFAKWLRGQDLNLRPLGYEWQHKRSFNELQGPIGSLK